MYTCRKTYGHEQGWSVAFRQWRADSHCSYIHGYALSFSFEFECDELDQKNWCVDFGGLKDLKAQLQDFFDHKTLVASDDPELETFRDLQRKGLVDLQVLPQVSCEAFARHAHMMAQEWLNTTPNRGRVRVRSVEVREHGSNSATYISSDTAPSSLSRTTK